MFLADGATSHRSEGSLLGGLLSSRQEAEHVADSSHAPPVRDLSARLSTRPSDFDARDSHKRFGMPCITLREDTRGNVSLFGMEPGGALQRLGSVRSGDVLVEVDGKTALGRTEKQVRGLLVGEKGSICTIHWISPDKVCSYININIYLYRYIHVHIHIYIHIYAYIHTYIHVCLHHPLDLSRQYMLTYEHKYIGICIFIYIPI